MHLPDGIVPATVCAAGFATAGLATWYSLRRIGRQEDPQAQVPKASLFTAVFFVASLVHVPVPPVSVHLILNGLLGVVLGWYAFPAILVGLFFQAVMFGHGGLTTLGVNATMLGVPALLAALLFRSRGLPGLEARGGRKLTGLLAFLGGSLGVGLTALILAVLLFTTVPASLDATAERAAIAALVLAHVPLALVEGVFTALVVLFLLRVDPGLLENHRGPPGREPGEPRELAKTG